MPDFLFHLPLPLAGTLIIGSLCLYSYLGLVLIHRLIMPRLRETEENTDFTGAMVQAVMVFYGLAVALVAVNVWETYSEVSGTVSQEASRLGGLYRDVSSYPEPIRTELRGQLHGYATHVIDEAWPMQREGQSPAAGVRLMNRFQTTLCTFEPDSEGRKILHGEALRSYNHLIEARRLRLDATSVRLPGVLWFVVVFGACVSLASTFLFKIGDFRLHIIQVLLLSIFVGLVITLILAFDRPFQGDLAIGPEPYRLIRDQLMDD
ncbi:MAG: DUF4239 domain-containing protein [Verrucomicrobiota bacterium]